MRPFLHEFLTEIYTAYDIIIWSAAEMPWIELKMKELGVTSNTNYKITAYFDYGAMITVSTEQYGIHSTKPLPVIWGLYPGVYTQKNTILVDDLGRNFLMAPQNGLKIVPFKRAMTEGKNDRVLLKLKRYLMSIAPLETFEHLNHADWEKTPE
eukprot:TRINITY_DN7097_c0_g1_i1.p1 TRINITY_DN7097_c0_g1~~TRINITY_DN7097_c0_g1_i1.p1  ORF type:complete len:153 (+),score=32.62 TRINITY_DN7097_c0_g1_i1:342-800(+)